MVPGARPESFARRLALASLVALVMAGVPFLLDDLRPALPFPDFSGYYLAGAALNEGASPYDPAAQRRIAARQGLQAEVSWSRFVYAPAVAAVVRPLAALPYRWASLLWLAGSFLALAVAVWRLARLYRWPRRRLARLFVMALCILTPASIETLLLGQVNTFVFLLTVAALATAARKSASPAPGVYLAVATALKIFPAGFLLSLPRRQQRVALVGFAVSCVLWLAVGLAAGGGPGTLGEWWRSVSPATQGLEATVPNQSIHGVMRRLERGGTYPARALPELNVRQTHLKSLVSPGKAAVASWTVVGLVLAASLMAVLLVPRRGCRRVDTGLRLSVLTSAALITAPLAWDHYHLLLLINAFVVLRAAGRSPTAWWTFAAGAALVVLHRYWRVLISVAGHGALSLALLGTVLCWIAALTVLLQRGSRNPIVGSELCNPQ
jgi:hypothetical protein